jgi:phospho-N-acetylmuramoyl-pentapeptide-transferase
MPRYIAWAKKKKANQPIYKHAPEGHQIKSTTPTMGGIVFLTSTLVASILTIRYNNFYALGGLLTMLLFAFIGIKDDMSKILYKKNEAGLSSKHKFYMQIAASLIIGIYLYFGNFLTELYIPFYKHPLFDMHILAIVFWTMVFVSTSNAVNLTDGLDGLATVPSIFSIMSLSVFFYIM